MTESDPFDEASNEACDGLDAACGGLDAACGASDAACDASDEAFDATWRELGLSRTLPPDSFGDTIDEETLTSLLGRALPGPEPAGPADPLPRIEVAEAEPSPRPSPEPSPQPHAPPRPEPHAAPRPEPHAPPRPEPHAPPRPEPRACPRRDLEVLALLGEGGMGRVLLARQHSLGREVAIKLLKPAAGAVEARALRGEAVVTGQLEHPNIVPVHALGQTGDALPLMVMKRVEGTSWWELLHDPDHPAWASVGPDHERRDHERPDPERRLVWHLETLMQLCNAVAFAHSRGVIHRDIKPENVMIGAFGQVYLVDWGLASAAITEKLPLLGTPAYMAPEMLRGAVGEWTDIYLLGATLHEVLTGQPRHDGDTLRELARAIHRSAPATYDTTVPAELAALANRATSRDPAERPASALELRQAIADHLEHRGSNALCASAEERLAEGLLALDGEPAAARRPLDVARFGYLQALERWPENPAALQGLRRCDEARVDLELGLGHVAAARAALDELHDPPPGLAARVDALEREQAAAEAEQARLRTMAAEMNQWEASTVRRVLVLLWSLPVLGGMAYLLVTARHARDYSHLQLLAIGAGELGLLVLAVALARRRLLRNVYNRRLTQWFLLLLGSMVFGRLVGLLAGVDQAGLVIGEAVAMGAMCGAGGVLLFRWFWLGTLFFWVAALVACVAPGAELIARMGAGGLTIIVCTLLWRPAPAAAGGADAAGGAAAGGAAAGGADAAGGAAAGGAAAGGAAAGGADAAGGAAAGEAAAGGAAAGAEDAAVEGDRRSAG